MNTKDKKTYAPTICDAQTARKWLIRERGPIAHPESNLQQACVRWYRVKYCTRPQDSWRTALLFAIPNGLRVHRTQAAIAKREGLVSGVADLCLLTKHGPLFIEMKAGKAGRQSPEQKAWQAAVERLGYRYTLCRSIDEFEALVDGAMRDT